MRKAVFSPNPNIQIIPLNNNGGKNFNIQKAIISYSEIAAT
jgi:hypothetical protein